MNQTTKPSPLRIGRQRRVPFSRKYGLNYRNPADFEIINQSYWNLTRAVKLRNLKKKNFQHLRTYFEKEFFERYGKFNQLKIHWSLWIGSRNIDFFVDSVQADQNSTGIKGRGLAIEIDGPIHHTQEKMNKDQWKFQTLDELGIMVTTVPNGDVFKNQIRTFLQQLPKTKRLDFRAKRRLLSDIFITTLEAHCDVETLSKLFKRQVIEKGDVYA